jgi:predicted ATP-binding protein involved in virulence
MKIENIRINNFRCFKEFQVRFTSGATVFIGKNGAGKTSILNAIRYALSVFFSNDKSMGENVLCAGNPDLKVITTVPSDFHREKNEDMPSLDLSIEIDAKFNDRSLNWEFYKKSTSGASLYPSKYQDAYRAFMEEYKESDLLPLFVFYSDGFPHVDTRVSEFANKAIQDQGYIIRNFAYYKWNSEVSCTSIWQTRFINTLMKQSSLKEEDNVVNKEIEYIKNKMIGFSKPVNDLYEEEYSFEITDFFPLLDVNNKANLYVRFKDRRDIQFDLLPAGYKRLYSIAFDLSYRLYILQMKNEKEPSGIAIIDEIDLHLHPSLEQEALIRFRRTFPKVQFIVSTHSPAVLANLKKEGEDNVIYDMKVEKTQPEELPDIYGIDYTTTMYDFMNTPRPENEVQEEKDAIIRLLRLGNSDLAQKRKEQLKSMVDIERYNQIIEEIETIVSGN